MNISKQVFAISAPFWIYFSLWIDCLVKMLKLKYLSLAFVSSSFRVTDENLLFETDLSCPRHFFRIFSLLLKDFYLFSLHMMVFVYDMKIIEIRVLRTLVPLEHRT